MTAGAFIIHDPTSNCPSHEIANDAINSEINKDLKVSKGNYARMHPGRMRKGV